MGRQKKEYKMSAFKLDAEVTEKLEAFCAKTGQTKTAVVEHGVLNYIRDFEELYEKMHENK